MPFSTSEFYNIIYYILSPCTPVLATPAPHQYSMTNISEGIVKEDWWINVIQSIIIEMPLVCGVTLVLLFTSNYLLWEIAPKTKQKNCEVFNDGTKRFKSASKSY